MLRLLIAACLMTAMAQVQLYAAPKCTTVTGDFTVKQGETTYNCKSKTTCTEYKCVEIGNQLRCGNSTTTTHGDCTAVQASGPGTVAPGMDAGVLDPGASTPPRRFLQVAPSTGGELRFQVAPQ